MVERIRHLLETRQLTPTQFADAMGVARPIVSHILSGRNKPSLEVVQKIIGAFPDLSLPWLLSGVGEMLASAVPPAPVASDVQDSTKLPRREKASGSTSNTRQEPQSIATTLRATEEPAGPLFEGAIQAAAAADAAYQPVSATKRPTTDTVTAPLAPATSFPNVAPSIAAAPAANYQSVMQKAAAPLPPPAALAFAEPDKAIRRIVIFYQDGTFTDYRPEAS